MKNNWNHLCRGMPRRQELDTWRAGQRRTRTCDVTQECEKLNYSDQLTVINEASVQCQDCQGAGLAGGGRSTCLAHQRSPGHLQSSSSARFCRGGHLTVIPLYSSLLSILHNAHGDWPLLLPSHFCFIRQVN